MYRNVRSTEMKYNFSRNDTVWIDNMSPTYLMRTTEDRVDTNGVPLLALRHLVSLPVSTPLRIVNRCWSCSCKWRTEWTPMSFTIAQNPKKTKTHLLAFHCLFLSTLSTGHSPFTQSLLFLLIKITGSV